MEGFWLMMMFSLRKSERGTQLLLGIAETGVFLGTDAP